MTNRIMNIRHTGIVVSDIDRSIDFYTKLLGFSIKKDMVESGEYIDNFSDLKDAKVRTVKMSLDSGDMVELLCYESHPEQPDMSRPITRIGCSHIALTVDDLDILDTTDLDHKNIKNYSIDLTKQDQIDKFIAFIDKNETSGINILINAAGVTFPNDLFNYSDKDWDLTYKVNLLAPFKLAKGLSKNMRDASIVNITSLNAELAFPNNPAYVATKHGLKGLTKSLALELGNKNVRVNNIGPGYMKTAMTSKSWSDPKIYEERKKKTFLGRWGTPSDLVGAVVFLASDASSYITGQDLYIDGGWTSKGL